tara:strand:- start:84 stop:218 length:135 start_codon:yes stop_codon:yes gene_type:complete
MQEGISHPAFEPPNQVLAPSESNSSFLNAAGAYLYSGLRGQVLD